MNERVTIYNTLCAPISVVTGDTNKDGEISKKEFRNAMPKLGFDLPTAAIDELFDSYDRDGSGAMDFAELQKAMSTGGKGWSAAKGGAVGVKAFAAKKGGASKK